MEWALGQVDVTSILEKHSEILKTINRKLYCTCIALLDNLQEEDQKTILRIINKDQEYKKILMGLLQDILPTRDEKSFQQMCSRFLLHTRHLDSSHFFKLQPTEKLYSDTEYFFNDRTDFYFWFRKEICVVSLPLELMEYMETLQNGILVSFGVSNSRGKIANCYGAKCPLDIEGPYSPWALAPDSVWMWKIIVDRLLDKRISYDDILESSFK